MTKAEEAARAVRAVRVWQGIGSEVVPVAFWKERAAASVVCWAVPPADSTMAAAAMAVAAAILIWRPASVSETLIRWARMVPMSPAARRASAMVRLETCCSRSMVAVTPGENASDGDGAGVVCGVVHLEGGHGPGGGAGVKAAGGETIGAVGGHDFVGRGGERVHVGFSAESFFDGGEHDFESADGFGDDFLFGDAEHLRFVPGAEVAGGEVALLAELDDFGRGGEGWFGALHGDEGAGPGLVAGRSRPFARRRGLAFFGARTSLRMLMGFTFLLCQSYRGRVVRGGSTGGSRAVASRARPTSRPWHTMGSTVNR